VAGIASGTWLVTEAPRTMNNPSWGALGAVIVAGLIMTVAFLFFTITFGLRYLDALVRAGLTLALLPVFLFFWIFQSTRSIAHAGLRSLLYMGAVFAASGFVFVICNEIMNFGFSKALGSNVTADGSQAFLNAMSQGGFNWFVGTGSGGDEANWLSFFYLMGAWGLSTKAASIVFQLAEEITQFQGGLTGAGKETEADLKDKASTGMNIAGGGAKMVGSGAMSLGSGAVRMMR
jgi:type IV secretory pathway VirB6-like protein